MPVPYVVESAAVLGVDVNVDPIDPTNVRRRSNLVITWKHSNVVVPQVNYCQFCAWSVVVLKYGLPPRITETFSVKLCG